MIFVVQGAEIQAQQRQAEAAGDGLGGQGFATALHAQQQHTTRRIQPRRRLRCQHDGASSPDPALEPLQAGDITELAGVVLEMQVSGTVEQVELQPRQRRQVIAVEHAIAVDQLAHDLPRLAGIQSFQIAHDGADRIRLHLNPTAAVGGGIALDLLGHDPAQGLAIGQAQRHAHRQPVKLRRQLHAVADQHQSVLGAILALHDLAQVALGDGVIQIRMQVEQHVRAGQPRRADRAQGGADIRRRPLLVQIDIEPAQAVGDRPAVQRPQDLVQQMPEQVDNPRLVGRVDQDQRRLGAQQGGDVAGFGHGHLRMKGRPR